MAAFTTSATTNSDSSSQRPQTPTIASLSPLSTNTSRGKLRVLCFHGSHTNAHVMRDQTLALRKMLGIDTEFVFLNGPMETQEESDPAIEKHYAAVRPFYEWIRCHVGDSEHHVAIISADVAKAVRASVSGDSEWFMRYRGLQDTLAYIDEQLQQLGGTFDVALGFSQGAMMLTLYSMWCLQHPDVEKRKRWWKLAVCVSGVRVNDINSQSLFEAPDGTPIPVPFPSVHVVGTQDPSELESRKLAQMYMQDDAGLVLEHSGSHHFPSLKHHKALYATLAGVMNQYRRPVVNTGTLATTPTAMVVSRL